MKNIFLIAIIVTFNYIIALSSIDLTSSTRFETASSSKQIESMAEFIQSEQLGYYKEVFPGNVQLRARKLEIVAKKLSK